ncbi:ABC-three component system middle component 6 [Bacillus cereus group sp. BfR-BA-01495]|uniref:ABC-three component system middle component 6 n=1 Tax=Bacillus cereus group sp. BfR-BA-01495 TaxID=2920363 RepID=UPI001F573DBB|nr:ABC-three component system middle component 6 [Bacillus cereus group sp. BfR-BA-01495]
MIIPDKHFEMQQSLIFQTGKIIEILLEDKTSSVDELFEKFRFRSQYSDIESFVLAVNFLFCLGKLEFYKEKDMLRLVDSNETKQTVLF